MGLGRLSALIVVAASASLAGCSSAKQLSTPGQASAFITAVARGGKSDDWQLATGAGAAATRAWAERQALHDLGGSLRREGSVWACEFAEGSVRLRSFGTFSTGDRTSLAHIASALGARQEDIDALLDDVLKLSVPDLSKAATAICALN